MKQTNFDFKGIFEGIHDYEDEYYVLNILFDFIKYCKSNAENIDKFKIEKKRLACNEDEVDSIIQGTFYFDDFIVKEIAHMTISDRKIMSGYIEKRLNNMPNFISTWYYYLNNCDKYYYLNYGDKQHKDSSKQVSNPSQKKLIFNDFDFEILNDPDFKEDSVREELIHPIIKSLGYSLKGDSRIIRSKSLVHPYVAIGSKRKKVSIVPDYLFTVENKPYWVLDAKSPTESIVKSKHVEQAYSYAIHPEVRAELFALCNGKEFSLYSIKKFEPILHFKLIDIDEHWNTLFRVLNPNIKATPEIVNYYPDYGLHLFRLGIEKGFKIILMAVHSKDIARVQDGLYTMTSVLPGEVNYILSLDFNDVQFKELLSLIPENLSTYINNSLRMQPYRVILKNDELMFGAVAVLKDEIKNNAEELFIPFEVQEFNKYTNVPF